MTRRVVIADGDADTADVAAFERDRRALLQRGFALGGVAIAASSIPLLLGVRNAFAKPSGDAAILAQAITLEQVAVLAYGSLVDGGLLTPAVRRTMSRFRDHEQEHADTLATALKDLGGIPPAPPKGVADVEQIVKGLSDVRSQAAAANFAIELETAAIAAYYDAHAKLIETRLLQTSASIMGNEGQHLAVLRMLAGENPIPNAFEDGST